MDCGAQHEKASARIQYFKILTPEGARRQQGDKYLKNVTFYRRLEQDSALSVCPMLGCQTTPPTRHCTRTNRICLKGPSLLPPLQQHVCCGALRVCLSEAKS